MEEDFKWWCSTAKQEEHKKTTRVNMLTGCDENKSTTRGNVMTGCDGMNNEVETTLLYTQKVCVCKCTCV